MTRPITLTEKENAVSTANNAPAPSLSTALDAVVRRLNDLANQPIHYGGDTFAEGIRHLTEAASTLDHLIRSRPESEPSK